MQSTLAQDAAAIAAPTLLVAGELDRVVPPGVSRSMTARIPAPIDVRWFANEIDRDVPPEHPVETGCRCPGVRCSRAERRLEPEPGHHAA